MTFLPELGGTVVKIKQSLAALYINISIKIRDFFYNFQKNTYFSFLSLLLSFLFLLNFTRMRYVLRIRLFRVIIFKYELIPLLNEIKQKK